MQMVMIKIPSPSELSDREWRADPIDGLRRIQHSFELESLTMSTNKIGYLIFVSEL